MKRFSYLIIFILANAYSYAQNELDVLKQQFSTYQQTPQERLFVHTDKNFYLAGETVWFKVYNADAASLKVLNLSKVAYVEILNHEGRPVLQAKIGLAENNGDGQGSFTIPAHMATGNYLLRAYTQWMRNFDEAYFFSKPLSIVNTAVRPDWQVLDKPPVLSVVFSPEGGHLVYGLQSKIGFRISENGKGIEAKGVVLNERNDTVARFQTYKFGIGNFVFKPEAGSTYKAVVNGFSVPLPKIYNEGSVMRVEDIGENKLRISLASTSSQNFYLIAHTRNQIKFAAAGKSEWTIDKNQLGEGVSIFTVFNAERKPVCERLYFKRPSQKLDININTPSEVKTRSTTSLHITSNDTANLSMSVYLIDSLQNQDLSTIESYLWLSSELDGPIESPGYYFGSSSEELNIATDNLMLTQGWRTFRWDDKTSKPAFNFLPEYEGLTIQAKVIDRSKGTPAAGIVSYVSVADEHFRVSNAVSNQQGDASFVIGNVFGPNELVVQTDSNSNRYRLDLHDPFAPKPASMVLPRFTLPANFSQQLNAHHLNTKLMNAYHPVQVQEFVPPPTADTTVFYGSPDKRYYLDDFTRFPTMEEVMREYVDAVRIIKQRDGFRYEALNIPAKLYFGEQPLVMIDGVPLFNAGKIVAFDPLKIKKIDVVGRKYYWGNLVSNGIVSYTTYDGDLAGFELDPAAVIMEFQGLQLQREFHAPDHSNARIPDTRNVLLWKSFVTKGKIELSLSASDIPGTYLVLVQGLSTSGVAGSKAITITVKE